MIPVPEVRLDASDAAVLAEMLQFLRGWFSRGPARLSASLEQFVGNPACNIGQLRGDLDRFGSCLAATTANLFPVQRGSRDRPARASARRSAGR